MILTIFAFLDLDYLTQDDFFSSSFIYLLANFTIPFFEVAKNPSKLFPVPSYYE